MVEKANDKIEKINHDVTVLTPGPDDVGGPRL